jgi:hypothetical protein
MAAPKKPPATAPIRIWSVDGSAVIASGEVPVAMLRGKSLDRAALFKELSRPKKEKPSTTDTMGNLLAASQRQAKRDTLADLAQRVDSIEAKLGLGRHQRRQAGFLPADVMAPPP